MTGWGKDHAGDLDIATGSRALLSHKSRYVHDYHPKSPL